MARHRLRGLKGGQVSTEAEGFSEPDPAERALLGAALAATPETGPGVKPGSLAAECAEVIARQFHATYESLAPALGWETQARSRTKWDDLPQENRDLMLATVRALLHRGVIRCGEHS